MAAVNWLTDGAHRISRGSARSGYEPWSRQGYCCPRTDVLGRPHLCRISIPPEQLARIAGLKLVPGMPAEAFIQTGERTALSYLVKPLSDQINRAFREN